jgi:hypothetical protein
MRLLADIKNVVQSLVCVCVYVCVCMCVCDGMRCVDVVFDYAHIRVGI